MKLKFSKRDDGEVVVEQTSKSGMQQFTYINLIKSLIFEGKLEESEIVGEFSEPEITSIKSMTGFINKEVDDFEKSNTDKKQSL
jgi:hypothetical protein